MSRTLISSQPDSFPEFLRKIWDYRALLIVFAVRDLKVKYAQTSLGLAWSLIQPLTALIIYTFFFEFLLNMSVGDFPYTLHVLSGLLGWNFFTYLVTSGSQSLQESSGLIKKIYFPKAILPLSKVIVAGVEMLISALMLFPLMLYFEVPLSVNVVFLPVVWLFNTLCALAIIFWLGALAIKKRDLYHLIPFLTYFGIWLTPVFFSADLLPESLSFLMDLNPMTNVLDLWRWALFGIGKPQVIHFVNFTGIFVVCCAGLFVFGRKENAISDFS